MAIWSRCFGSFTINKSSGFSLRKHVAVLYDEVTWLTLTQNPRCAQGDRLTIEFDFEFSLDGMGAAELVSVLVRDITNTPGYSGGVINSEIRFI
jgi:hypothetical protein